MEQSTPEPVHKQRKGARWDAAAGSETARLILEQTLQVCTLWTFAISLACNGAGKLGTEATATRFPSPSCVFVLFRSLRLGRLTTIVLHSWPRRSAD